MDNQEQIDTVEKAQPQNPSWMVGVLSFAAGFAFCLVLCTSQGQVDITIKSKNVYLSHQEE